MELVMSIFEATSTCDAPIALVFGILFRLRMKSVIYINYIHCILVLLFSFYVAQLSISCLAYDLQVNGIRFTLIFMVGGGEGIKNTVKCIKMIYFLSKIRRSGFVNLCWCAICFYADLSHKMFSFRERWAADTSLYLHCETWLISKGIEFCMSPCCKMWFANLTVLYVFKNLSVILN